MKRSSWSLRTVGITALRTLNVLTILAMLLSAPLNVYAFTSTDQEDYSPGATVTIFGDNRDGAGYLPGETVQVKVYGPPDYSVYLECDAVADENGAWTCQVTLPVDSSAIGLYHYVTLGLFSGVSERGNFTDGSIGTYDQCSNDDGDGYATGDTGCRWINGNLQSNNSTYREGDATPQRLWLTEYAPGSTHTVTLQYGTSKGGSHAYDYLTTYNFSEDWIVLTDRCEGINGCETAAETTFAIPEDPLVPFDDGTQLMTMRGGSITGITTPQRISGDYTGDSETTVKVSFTVNSSGDMCSTKSGVTTCGVALWFGAHVALTSEWEPYDGGTGAGGISGSPYHVALAAVDEASIGQRDNQMQAGAVLPNGTIIIVKDAVPNDAQDFDFELTNGISVTQDFSLDDDADLTLPNSETFSVPAGIYTATELGPLADWWHLTSIVCTDATSNTTISLADMKATIDVASGETVTCTFTNTKQQNSDLMVSKTAVASYGRLYKWLIDKSVDDTQIEIAEGGKATFHYTVDLTPNGYTDSGWAVNGVITVSNPNAFDVEGVDITDSIDNGGACSVTNGTDVTIPANDHITRNYTCTYAAAPSPLTGTNTATATWDQAAYYTPTGTASGTASVDFGAVTPTATNKTINVTDTLGGALGTSDYVNGPFSFTYSHDFAGVGGTCTDYDNTATITETGQNDKVTVTVCVGKDLTISKTAAGTFNRSYLWSIAKDVDKTQINIAAGGTATFNYSVTVTQTGVSDSGWALSGAITISNPNDWEAITLTGLTDTVDNGGICAITEVGPYVVPKSGSLVLHYTCSYAAAPSSLSGTNTATATWDKAAAFTPSGTASGSKTFTLSQSGSTNKTVNVTDSLGGNLGTVTATDTAPFASKTFNYSHGFSGVGGTCTDYDNTATITETGQTAGKSVKVCVGLDLTVSKTAAGTFNRAYLWSIDKSVDDTRIEIALGGLATFNYKVDVVQTGISDSGWTLAGKITLTNPNDWEAITLTNLTDVVDNGGACTVAVGPYVVPADGSLDVSYSCSFATAPTSLSGKNTATATWDKAAAFTPNGTASGEKAFTLSQLGATNKTIHVTDTLGGSLGTVTATDGAPFATASFTYSKGFAGVGGTCTDYDNTATITETEQSDNQKVTVCVGKDLTISKTAAGTKDRLYKWLIDKSVDDTLIEIAAGGKATFNYSVKVTPNGYTDSGYTLGGTITLVNPNDWEDITLTSLLDTLDQGGTCAITEAAPYKVSKSGSLTVHYTCSTDGLSTKNTATAAWDKAAYFTPNGSAAADAAVSFGVGSETNKIITVIDDKTDPAHPVTLGTWNWADGEHTFTYSLDKSGVGGTCTDYTNTAVIDETDQSDTQKVTVCAGLDLTVSKTAAGTFNRSYLWSIAKDVDKTQVNIASGGKATFNYTVSVTQTGISDAGWTLSGVITITNPNDWKDITLTGLADVVDNGGICTVAAGPYVVEASDSLDVAYSCSYAVAPSSYSGKNTATATWDKAIAFTPSGTASGEKAFTLTQLGATNKTVHVTDSLGGNLGTVTATDIAPFAAAQFTYSKDFEGVGGTCTDYDNTATITETGQTAEKSVKVCVGLDLTLSKTAAGTFNRTYLWQIAKAADKTQINIAQGGTATFNYTVDVTQTGISDSGWTLAGKITLTNPNDWEDITLTSLADAVDNGGICTVAVGPYVVPKSGTLEVGYTCSFSSAPTNYSGKNTATANWDKALYFTPSGSASGEKAFTLAQLGSTNKTVHVTDTLAGSLGTVTATDAAPFTTASFQYSHEYAGVGGTCKTYDNTATITETGQSASKTVKVCVGLDLTVSKTAAGTFDRTYKWLIDKSVDDTLIEIAAGGKATFNYTVKLTPDGFTDSGWTLAGKITITNPNDWEDITADVVDAFDGGGVCTVTGGTDVVIAASGSVTLDYSCVFATKPAYTGKNTATATWDKALFFTPTGTASGSAEVTLGLKGETNRTITVIDDKTDPSNPVTLGTSDYYVGPFEYKYALEKAGVAGTCKDYTNTAVIDETDQSDSQKVTVCVGLDLTVTKTASGTFDRTYKWLIAKDADKTSINATVGDIVTINYVVKVTPDGYVDGNFVLGGTITLVNPNDWEAITLTSLADTLDKGGTCAITEAAPYVVPKSGSLTVHYTCSTDGTTTKNTATAVWDASKYFTPTGTASGSANVSLTLDKEFNKTITVKDDKTDPAHPVTLGTAYWPDGVKEFKYSLQKEAEYGCFNYTNIAWIVETGQNAKETIQICGMYWSFTPGFWKNHTTDTKNGHDAWKYTAYLPTDKVGAVFNGAYLSDKPRGSQTAFKDLTLLAALSLKGGAGLSGAKETLLRAGVAALLNASFNEEMGHPAGYPMSVQEVINAVNTAMASGDRQTILNLAAQLDGYNNGTHYIDWNWPAP